METETEKRADCLMVCCDEKQVICNSCADWYLSPPAKEMMGAEELRTLKIVNLGARIHEMPIGAAIAGIDIAAAVLSRKLYCDIHNDEQLEDEDGGLVCRVCDEETMTK